jgi:RNA polymerase sigma-70 factor (ECF subfamily)
VTTDTLFQDLRPLLFALAYRMLGAVAEAEDIVQEAFLRYHRAATIDGVAVQTPKAYLATVTTRLAIDQLRSARVRREAYVGTWLPEPLITDERTDPAHLAEINDSVSIALLVILETLTPVERAVYLLHEVFDYSYGEIAVMVDRSQDNCRQLATRARRHITERRVRFDVDSGRRTELAQSFFAACATGDAAQLARLLAKDATFYGDGGGKASAVRAPVVGSDHVIRFLLGLFRQASRLGVSVEPAQINGQFGVLSRDARGLLISVVSLDIKDGQIRNVYGMVNPDKLTHLGPVSDEARTPEKS